MALFKDMFKWIEHMFKCFEDIIKWIRDMYKSRLFEDIFKCF